MGLLASGLAQLSDGHDGLDALSNGADQAQQVAAQGGDASAVQDATAANQGSVNKGEQPNAEAPYIAADPEQAVQEALRSLVRGYELESDSVRRHKVRIWRKAEEFWKGSPNGWYSERDGAWHTPFESPGRGDTDGGRSERVHNYFRPWGLSVIAALTSAPVKLNYLPVSAESQEDIATAKAAQKIAELVARNNNLQTLRVKKGYYLWTQGIFATFIRFVVDGGQFGYHSEDVMGEQTFQVLPDRYECQECGGYQPADSDESSGMPGAPVGCNTCGALMGPESFSPAENITATMPVDTRRVPNGAEKLTTYGPLFIKLPPQAQGQRDCYYLIQVEEQHKAVLRAAYPQKANRIEDVGSGGEDTYERIVRLSLADAQGSWNTLPMSSLVTYKRAWLRPESFWAHAEPEMRKKLLGLYPDGCRVEFAGDVFLQAVPEKLDDYWEICTGLPGIGIYRDPLGLDAVSVQEEINDTANLKDEFRNLASCPPVFYDARVVNGEALQKRKMEPASFVPFLLENVGQQYPIEQAIWQPKFTMDANIWQEEQRLAECGQFFTGALPSLFGGGIPDVKTASAYKQAKDQAMGRLTLVWKQMREAEANEMTKAIVCYQRNRTDDEELVVEGKSGQFRSQFIRLNEIQGNVIAAPSADEDFPQTFAEIQGALQQILQTKDPAIIKALGVADPVNFPILTHYIGLDGLTNPDEEDVQKQFIEIEALIGSTPIIGPDGNPQPSIQPEAGIDDDDIHIETIRTWSKGSTGLDCKARNPDGYQNVQLHRLMHEANRTAQAAQQAQQQAAVAAAGAPPNQQPAQPDQGPQPPNAPGAAPSADASAPTQTTA
jgi:rubredoxin